MVFFQLPTSYKCIFLMYTLCYVIYNQAAGSHGSSDSESSDFGSLIKLSTVSSDFENPKDANAFALSSIASARGVLGVIQPLKLS
mmetsp:Transcript_3487/g.7340  ORF Transcript_3487/g.7340 Transcript_3487/m.7340 type:complete len:85 (-) Transcript_3487:3941-4195(-)